MKFKPNAHEHHTYVLYEIQKDGHRVRGANRLDRHGVYPFGGVAHEHRDVLHALNGPVAWTAMIYADGVEEIKDRDLPLRMWPGGEMSATGIFA